MRPKHPFPVACVLAAVVVSVADVGADTFQPLDFRPAAVSADGSVVVGLSAGQALRWTRETEEVPLGFLRPQDENSGAAGVSADGSVVVGSSGNEAFRWTAETGMVALGFLYPEDSFASYARDVSADGAVVVGYDRYYRLGTFSEAFRWTAETGMVDLGTLPGHRWSHAHGVSADGSVVVGSSGQAFRWTADGGMLALGALTFGSSGASAVSADGAVVVGESVRQVFRWTAETGMVDLGSLPPLEPLEVYRNEVYGVSADGSLAVGTLLHISDRPWDDPVRAWIWDETHGMRDLQDLLSNDFGLELPGWDLVAATDISGDGRVIVGWGWYTPPGVGPRPRGYRAVIPEPSSYALLSCGLVWLLAYTWQKRRQT